MYEYARQGIEVERAPREVRIHELQMAPADGPEGQTLADALKIRVRCSKGTYIRTLGQDIGDAFGCGGHLTALRRVVTGPFDASQCTTLEALEAMPDAERLGALLPPQALLPDHTAVTLESEDAGRFLSGMRRRGAWPDREQVAVFGAAPYALLGTAHIKAGELIPVRLLSPIQIQEILAALSRGQQHEATV